MLTWQESGLAELFQSARSVTASGHRRKRKPSGATTVGTMGTGLSPDSGNDLGPTRGALGKGCSCEEEVWLAGQPVDGRSTRYIREQAEDGQAKRSIISGARSASVAWLASLAPWELYVTLTYDRTRAYQPSPKDGGLDGRAWVPWARAPSFFASQAHLGRWHAEAQEAVNRPLFLASAFELTKQSWPHWHGILASGGLSEAEFTVLSKLWYQRRGFARFARIHPGTEEKVAAYLTKYFTKGDESISILGCNGLPAVAVQSMMRLGGSGHGSS